MKLIIGTRGSELALWQARHVQKLLEIKGIKIELKIIETKGDKILDRSLSKIGSKGLFTEELEQQLREGKIDLAVHSAKDLPSDLEHDLSIIAFTTREKCCDVLISKKNICLNPNADFVIGTSSTRRVAMLKAYYPKLKIVDMRGNLQTRIKKMDDGICDALILAYAGIYRLGYQHMIVQEFDIQKFTPPAGQGSIAIEICNRLDLEKIETIRNTCNDPETEVCLIAERSFLYQLKGGCSIPGFCHVQKSEQGGLRLHSGLIGLNGIPILQNKMEQNNTKSPERLGYKAAKNILQQGGAELLIDIRSKLNQI